MFEKLKSYFREDLWNFSLHQTKGLRKVWIQWQRIIYLAARRFYQDKCPLSASSLTYYTMMSIVPILAMAFAIVSGFGYSELFKSELLQRFNEQHIVLSELFKFADAFLDQAKGGIVAGAGLVFLFVTVILLLNNLETIFNHIWGVKNIRSWRRIVSDYFSLMLLAPILFIMSSSAAVFTVNYLGERLGEDNPVFFFVKLIPYALFWIFFTFIYLFMPNTKVRFSSACLAGLFTSCLYLVVQWGYLSFQSGANRYGTVYGSMAALPLFLIWVQMSWLITLFGTELSYAHQTHGAYEFEVKVDKISLNFKRLLSLWITHLAVKKGFLSKDLLLYRYQIPDCLASMILKDLIAAEILYEANGGYVPAAKTLEMRITDLVEALDLSGENDFPLIESKELRYFEGALEKFRKQIESTPNNTRLNHVPN